MTPETEVLIAEARRVIREGCFIHGRTLGQIIFLAENESKRADAEHERAEVLQSQVDNADTNLAQVRMIWKARADAAEAKLKVAQIALERIDERSAHPTTGTSELWAIAANALEALTQPEP